MGQTESKLRRSMERGVTSIVTVEDHYLALPHCDIKTKTFGEVLKNKLERSARKRSEMDSGQARVQQGQTLEWHRVLKLPTPQVI